MTRRLRETRDSVICELDAQGVRRRVIAKRVGMSIAGVYRVLKKFRDEQVRTAFVPAPVLVATPAAVAGTSTVRVIDRIAELERVLTALTAELGFTA